MKTAVTMLGEAFRQWQKDWESYDKGISDKPKSYNEFIEPFIEKEKEQIIDFHIMLMKNGLEQEGNLIEWDYNELKKEAEEYYNQTYNQNK